MLVVISVEKLLLLFVLTALACAHFYAIDQESNSWIFTVPSDSRQKDLAHFGFSLATVKRNGRPTVIVGAPRFNQSMGAAFACLVNISGDADCRQLRLANTYQKSTMQHARIGASVSSDGHGQPVFVVCAPGYTTVTRIKHSNFNYHAFVGTCQLHISEDKIFNYHSCPALSSERNVEAKSINKSSAPVSRGCLSGMSSSLVSHNSNLYLGIGMPGDSHSGESYFGIARFNLQGIYQDEKHFRISVGSRNKLIGLSHSYVASNSEPMLYVVPETSVVKEWSDTFLYFLKVDSKTDSDSKERSDTSLRNSIMIKLSPEDRPKSFEFFGFSAITLSSKNVKMMYEAVGAPFGLENKREVGCVYIISSRTTLVKRLCGNEIKGRFGASLLNIGDMNFDDQDDFVVGCPFCGDGEGAVYMYISTPVTTFLYLQHQVLRPSSARQVIRGFGWSLAGGMDFNSDGITDLVVGAPLSDRVVILRGMPLIDVENRNVGKVYSDHYVYNYAPLRLLNDTFQVNVSWELHLRFPKQLSALNASRRYSVVFEADPGRSQKRLTFFNESLESLELVSTPLNSGWQTIGGLVSLIWHPRYFLRDMRSPLKLTVTLKSLSDGKLPAFSLNNATNQLLMEKRLLAPACQCDSDGLCRGDLELGGQNLSAPTIFLLGDWSTRDLTVRLLLHGTNPVWGAQLLVKLPDGLLLDGAMKLRLNASTTVDLEFAGEANINNSQAYSLLYPGQARPLLDPKEGQTTAWIKFSLRLNPQFDFARVSYSLSSGVLLQVVPQEHGTLQFANCGGWNDFQPDNNAFQIPMQLNFNSTVWLSAIIKKDSVLVEDRRPGETLQRAAQGIIAAKSIGPQLIAIWSLKLDGVTPVDGLVVDLEAPFLTQNGRHLLYFFQELRTQSGQQLNALPRLLDGRTGAFLSSCRALAVGIVNPMNLTAVENDIDLSQHRSSSERLKRKRRFIKNKHSEQRELLVSSSSVTFLTSSDQINAPLTLACGKTTTGVGLPLCVKFRCSVPRISLGNEMHLRLDARLWADTFLREGLTDVRLQVTAVLRATANHFSAIGITFEKKKVASISRFYFRHAVGSNVVRIKIWPIIVGASLGILFLIVIVTTLYKCGFFVRKRILDISTSNLHNNDDGYK